MPRSADRHPIEIPKYLWQALAATAEAKNITMAQLVAKWLTESAHQHASDEGLSGLLQAQLLALPRVDGRYTYPRRSAPAAGQEDPR